MIKSNRNQLMVAKNDLQGPFRRVLCVCSAGCLRSPTIARVLAGDFNYNTRSCGVDEEFALIPVSEALLHWAEEVVFAEQYHMDKLMLDPEAAAILKDKDIIVLNIPDDFNYGNKDLKRIILERYSSTDYV